MIGHKLPTNSAQALRDFPQARVVGCGRLQQRPSSVPTASHARAMRVPWASHARPMGVGRNWRRCGTPLRRNGE